MNAMACHPVRSRFFIAKPSLWLKMKYLKKGIMHARHKTKVKNRSKLPIPIAL